jgi:hypothetical protein
MKTLVGKEYKFDYFEENMVHVSILGKYKESFKISQYSTTQALTWPWEQVRLKSFHFALRPAYVALSKLPVL